MIEGLSKGAFLTVKNGNKINTMTIGWATFGRVWNLEVCTVMVRYSRYTHDIIKNADSFTISFSLDGKLKKELGICGSKSGRDIDKFKHCKLTTVQDDIESPYIAEGDLHLLCDILYKQPMDIKELSPELKEKWYPDGDLHVIYYGKIRKVLAK